MVVPKRLVVAAVFTSAILGASLSAAASAPVAQGETFCGICTPHGATVTAAPANVNISFVAIAFEIGTGACEWDFLDCEPVPLGGCSYGVVGAWVRGTPPLEVSLAAVAIAKPDCGSAGTTVDTSVGGVLTVSVTCGPCLEGPG